MREQRLPGSPPGPRQLFYNSPMQWGIYVAIFSSALTVLGLISGFIYHRKNRTLKVLDFEIISDTALLDYHTRRLPGLAVTVNEKRLEWPRLVTIKYRNAGSEVLLPGDFKEPIRLVSPPGRYTYPDNPSVLIHSVTVDETPIEVSVHLGLPDYPSDEHWMVPELMNRGESLYVNYLVDNFAAGITPSYRIVNASRPPKNLTRGKLLRRRAAQLALGVVAAACVMTLVVWRNSVDDGERIALQLGAFMCVGLIFAISETRRGNEDYRLSRKKREVGRNHQS